jgi:hypothetical protein
MSAAIKTSPTSVRLDNSQLSQLEKIKSITRLAKGTLISLAVSALIDHVERTGKLPLPYVRRKNQNNG